MSYLNHILVDKLRIQKTPTQRAVYMQGEDEPDAQLGHLANAWSNTLVHFLYLILQMRVSKEVAALRDFEQSLLKGYQAFLKTLLTTATAKPPSGSGSSSSVLATARVAVRCMGQLLLSRPGFNYSRDLLQVRCRLLTKFGVTCELDQAYGLNLCSKKVTCRLKNNLALVQVWLPSQSASGLLRTPLLSNWGAYVNHLLCSRCQKLLVSYAFCLYHTYNIPIIPFLQALVPLMVHPDTEIRNSTCDTIKQLLLEDIQGATSLEAVQLVADLVRKKKCSVHPLVVSSLLVARFEQVIPTSQGGEGIGSKVRSQGRWAYLLLR